MGARWNDYLSVGNVKVGVRFTDVAPQTVTTRYFHTDHLGSIAVITNEAGAVVERLSYDAWGKRRFPNGADDPAGSIESLTTRGFTGHEELDSVGLVHMNGRVYDPLVARMISPDPTIPDALNGQAWNRYSYVGNDPLTFTDPNGYSWLSNVFHSIGNAISSLLQRVPILRAIAQIVITAVLSPFAGPFAAAALGAAIVNGLSGGNLGTMLKSAAIAGATAFAFYGVGELTGHTPAFGTPAYAANVAGHAGVGCLTSVASGGSCQSGALSGAAGAAATPLVNVAFPNPRNNTGDLIGGTAATGIVGGLASVAGGGKFENGAVTAAFGYMFNAARGRLIGGIIGGAAAGALGIESGPGAALTAAAGRLIGGELGSWIEDVYISRSRHPETAAHIEDAIGTGQPNVLTIDREGAIANRSAATGGIDRVPRMHLDEYPPAMFREGGSGASVRPITPADNMGAGACMGNQCRGLPNGARVRINVRD